jgi:hypothetical protein
MRNSQGTRNHRAWAAAYDTIRRLGVDGMSSDDSEIDRTLNLTVYRTRRMPWRRDMGGLLDLVDSHRPQRGSGYSKKGAEPAPRLPGPGVSSRETPSGLPRVLYDRAWLATVPRLVVEEDIKPDDSDDYQWIEVASTT